MKSKFNIIIPFRGRHSYLTICLKSLDIAAKDHNVNITLVSDEDFKFNDDEKYDVNISFYKVPKKYEQFNKSYLLNNGLKLMRQNFNYVSIVDCDMIYNPKFFEILENEMDENTYFISGGYKLTNIATEQIFDCFPGGVEYNAIRSSAINSKLTRENNLQMYPSQISLRKSLYNKVLDILETKDLYHEGFIGWGGEDSYLSFFSRKAHNKCLLKRHYNKNIWYHLYHQPANEAPEYNEAQFQKNKELLYKLDVKLTEKIIKYANRSR